MSDEARAAWIVMADAVQSGDREGCVAAMTVWAGAAEADLVEGIAVALVALYSVLLERGGGEVPEPETIAGWAQGLSERLIPLIPTAEPYVLEQVMLVTLGYPGDEEGLAGLNLIGLVLALVGEIGPRGRDGLEALYMAAADEWAEIDSDEA